MNKSKVNLIKAIFIVIGFLIFFIWQNNGVGITNYEYSNSKLPKGFDSFKILQISDLHNKDFHGSLYDKIQQIDPDIIVITGDLIDRRNTRIEIATDFIQQIAKIAPIYFVTGNHEQLSVKYNELKEEIENLNVKIMDHSYATLHKNEDKIGLMGIADPAIMHSESTYILADDSGYVQNSIFKLFESIDTDFNILLSHRPEQFHIYKAMNVDLVFSGHAHGGQIRFPFIGGLVAPNQGFFPKFTQGIYSDGSTSMIVSRGLGNSIIPLRLFNRPELVVVTLKGK